MRLLPRVALNKSVTEGRWVLHRANARVPAIEARSVGVSVLVHAGVTTITGIARAVCFW
jgi:hypothetical protein